MSTELDKKAPAGALAVSEYADDAGGGFENQTTADKSIPFLNVLQDGSPQVKKRDPAYIEGAESGMILNSITGEVYDGQTGVIVIPCVTEHAFVEWVPRDKGGGFKGKHALGSQVVLTAQQAAKDRKLKTPEGNDLVETFYMYALTLRPKVDLRKGFVPLAELIDLDSLGDPVLLPFTSTKITSYKKINTQIGMYKIPGVPFPANQPPLWAFPLWATTKLEKRDSGDSFNIDLKFAGGGKIEKELLLPRFKAPGQEFLLYKTARELKKAASSGGVKVDYDRQGGAAPQGGGGGEEADIPF